MTPVALVPLKSNKDHPSGLRKLGVLGGTFEDGTVSFYVVPDPDKRDASLQTTGPLYGNFCQ